MHDQLNCSLWFMSPFVDKKISNMEHRSIIDAIMACDAARARATMQGQFYRVRIIFSNYGHHKYEIYAQRKVGNCIWVQKTGNEKEYVGELFARARKDSNHCGYLFPKKSRRAGCCHCLCNIERNKWLERLAILAYEETGMGNIESKYLKLAKKIPGCFYDVKRQKTVDIIEYNQIRYNKNS